jgi:hypothetical protein
LPLSEKFFHAGVDNATRTSLNLRNSPRGKWAPIVFGDGKQ